MSKCCILVIDDEEIVRRGYARALTAADCVVHTAWDAKDALAALERRAFDVVLLDLRMPEANGLDVLRTIKDKWPESEVVIVTGYPSLETAKEAVRLGACDYLAKPVAPDQVIHAANGARRRKRWALHRAPQGQHADDFDMRARTSPA